MSGRTIAQKYQVSRRTVRAALTSAWPQPRKQRHTVKRIYDRLIDEHGMHDVSYPVVRAYVADGNPQIRAESGLARSRVNVGPGRPAPVVVTTGAAPGRNPPIARWRDCRNSLT